MVGYMSGSKRARNTPSIVSRGNVCGGPKKGGLAPRVGRGSQFTFRAIQFRATSSVPFSLTCPANFRNNPGGQASGGVGRMFRFY